MNLSDIDLRIGFFGFAIIVVVTILYFCVSYCLMNRRPRNCFFPNYRDRKKCFWKEFGRFLHNGAPILASILVILSTYLWVSTQINLLSTQINILNKQSTAQMLFELRKEFESTNMNIYRKTLAAAILNGDPVNFSNDRVIQYFETLGYFWQRKMISEEDIWQEYCVEIVGYRDALNRYPKFSKETYWELYVKKFPKLYENFDLLAKRIEELDREAEKKENAKCSWKESEHYIHFLMREKDRLDLKNKD
ncbi:MAG: hypothetical protein AB9917_19125 [Negativicutes bacterium]